MMSRAAETEIRKAGIDAVKQKQSRYIRMLIRAVLCLCAVFCVISAGADSGISYDEEGGVWNYDLGIYTDPSGQTHQITPEGVSDDSGLDTALVENADGSMTVISADEDPTAAENLDLPPETTRAPLTTEEWEQRLERAAALNGAYTPTIYKDPLSGKISEVEVRYMGIGRSMVVLDGRETLVNTVDLEWATQAPADKVLAVINTPKNGYAAMYAGKSKKTTLIKQCRLDQVVRVINTGKTWTLVDHDGTRGFVQTSSLEFYTNDHVEFDAGYLTVRGRMKGHDTANVRSRDRTHRCLTDYQIGTPLTVFDVIDQWAEIDVCGWHCVINSEYLTLERELGSAASK